jgi:membrane glycosyltransferase
VKQSLVDATRCEAYLERLPISAERRLELRRVVAGAPPEKAMAALHRALGGARALDNPAAASLSARLALATGAPPGTGPGGVPTVAADGRALPTTPAIRRTSMAPRHWPPRLTVWPLGHLRGKSRRASLAPRPRRTDGSLRRTVLTALILGQSALATWSMTSILPYHGARPMEIAVLILFAILFFWVSAGFWTAIMGFVLLLSGRDRHAISASACADAPIGPEARTAIVMPICNEDVTRVFAGLRATYASLERSKELGPFDFFVLSDSNDADLRVAETEAWLRFCRETGGFGRIFYRWRRNRIKRKSGNIADFCRRWGGQYRYMIILDADSVMSGECLSTLVRLMEANPRAGIIQTAPRASGRETLHSRIQQFANRVYGPLFTAGLHFWQLGEAHYWGHNAIIRLAPFIRHCALGRLKRRGVHNLEILSHDFVEAALMRAAGWSVWIAYDLPGSHEEMPPNLLDELQRDQRWCQGNLINSRLLLAEGLHPAHRVVFATGVMAYFSAPLWFLFLVLSTVLLAVQILVPPQYFVNPHQLFPVWPEWNHQWAVTLFSATATLLFAPKILSVVLLWRQGCRDFGGWYRLALSALAEALYSVLLAPVRMLFHTRFVIETMAGWHVGWKSPTRDNMETTWGEALRRHGWHTLLGIGWAAGVYWLHASSLWWLLPVVGALMLSIPISVWSSRVSLGRRLRRRRVFLIPEETNPPFELRCLYAQQEKSPPPRDFVAAVTDPLVNALVCAVNGLRQPPRETFRTVRHVLVNKALLEGPAALSRQQKLDLLDDPASLSVLHLLVWSANTLHPSWDQAIGVKPCADATF